MYIVGGTSVYMPVYIKALILFDEGLVLSVLKDILATLWQPIYITCTFTLYMGGAIFSVWGRWSIVQPTYRYIYCINFT